MPSCLPCSQGELRLLVVHKESLIKATQLSKDLPSNHEKCTAHLVDDTRLGQLPREISATRKPGPIEAIEPEKMRDISAERGLESSSVTDGTFAVTQRYATNGRLILPSG